MPKKNPKRQSDVEAAPAGSQEQGETKKSRKAFKGSTGYNYGEDYYFRGGRTPSKTDWDAMSQEEREQIGLGDWDTFHAAQKAHRAGHVKGGGNYQSQTNLAQALMQGGASSWQDILRIAGDMGYADAPDQGRALLKRLKMAFEGTADPSGRYHRGGDGWVDVGTSDLNKRGIAGAADYFGGTPGGIEAVLMGLGGGGELLWNQQDFGRRVAQGDWTEWPPGSGKFFNDPGNDPSRRVWVGSNGQPTAPPMEQPDIDYSKVDQTKQTLAQYLSGHRTQQQQDADYWKKASEATPYTPGSTPTQQPQQGTAVTSAWGVPGQSSQGRQQPRTDTRRPPISDTYQQPQQPQYNRPGNAYSGPTVFGQPRQRKNIWGIQ